MLVIVRVYGRRGRSSGHPRRRRWNRIESLTKRNDPGYACLAQSIGGVRYSPVLSCLSRRAHPSIIWWKLRRELNCSGRAESSRKTSLRWRVCSQQVYICPICLHSIPLQPHIGNRRTAIFCCASAIGITSNGTSSAPGIWFWSHGSPRLCLWHTNQKSALLYLVVVCYANFVFSSSFFYSRAAVSVVFHFAVLFRF